MNYYSEVLDEYYGKVIDRHLRQEISEDKYVRLIGKLDQWSELAKEREVDVF